MFKYEDNDKGFLVCIGIAMLLGAVGYESMALGVGGFIIILLGFCASWRNFAIKLFLWPIYGIFFAISKGINNGKKNN